MAHALELNQILRRRSDLMTRHVAEGLMIVDMGSGRCWELNAVGTAVWAALASPKALLDVCDSLEGNSHVARDVLERDVLELARSLDEAGLLERVAPPETADEP